MKNLRIIAAMMMGLGLSACASVETATRNAPMSASLDAPQPAAAATSVMVKHVIVEVPRSLKVSEANRFFPGGDIVWREDPLGDRYSQVRSIVETALVQGVTPLMGTTEVDLHVEITRFHSLSEKARYTVGGVHDIEFKLTLLNPETHLPISAPRDIKASLKAYGGGQAIAAEGRGETQKFRIIQHLAKVIEAELTQAGGYQQAKMGLLEVFN